MTSKCLKLNKVARRRIPSLQPREIRRANDKRQLFLMSKKTITRKSVLNHVFQENTPLHVENGRVKTVNVFSKRNFRSL